MARETTVYAKGATAASDTPFQVDFEPKNIVTSVNIHCFTNDCYYGNSAYQLGVIKANAVAWFDGAVRISDLWFKNYTPGSNCVIAIVGILKG